MSTSNGIAVTLTALPDTQEDAARIVEVLTRTATGLAFDGLSVQVNITPYDTEEDANLD